MRIGYDAKRIFNNKTGLGNYSRALLRNVHQLYPENEYVLFTPKVDQSIKTNFFQETFKTVQAENIPSSLWRSFLMSKDIAKEGIDIFHGLSNEIPKGINNIKSVVTIHDLIFNILPDTYPKFDRWMYHQKTKFACKNADVIIAISENTKRDIIQYYGVEEEKIKVVYQSCNPIYYQENKWNSKLLIDKLKLPKEFILSVGSLEKRKNTRSVLEAISAIDEKKRIPLYILGKGNKYKKELQDYIQVNKLRKWIYFIDEFISLPELKCLYELAELVVYPSLYEGFGLPVVESLLSKTPVITSDLSSLPEAAGPYSKLVNPNNIESIKDAILEILNDSNLQEKMKREGYEYAISKFYPRTVTEQLIDIYKDL